MVRQIEYTVRITCDCRLLWGWQRVGDADVMPMMMMLGRSRCIVVSSRSRKAQQQAAAAAAAAAAGSEKEERGKREESPSYLLCVYLAIPTNHH